MRPLLSNAAASEKRLECWLPRWGRQNINTPAPDAAVLPRYIREKPADLAGFSSVVDYTSNLSNFFEDLQKLDAFAKSVEYLLVNDNKEKARTITDTAYGE